MSHDLDDDLMVPPDRRPLVYGGAAIVILLVAAFLFWPRGQEGPVRDELATSSLVPPGQTTRASDESVRADAAPLTADAGLGTDIAAVVDDAVQEPTGTPANPAVETRIVEETPQAKQPEITKAPVRSAPETTTPTRVRETPTAQPLASGDWVLNVGSFSSRQNADRRAEELTRQGISSHVQVGSSGSGATVYRVRVGYFGSSADAKAYGNWLKSSQELDSWASRR